MKTTIESFEDIVFKNRNKDYGAYELRKRYSKRGTIAFVISISILFMAFGGPLIANMMGDGPINPDIPLGQGPFAPIHPVTDEPVVPPSPQPKPVNPNDFMNHQIRVVDNPDEEADLPTNDELAQGANLDLNDTTSNTKDFVIVEDKAPVVDVIYETFAIQEKPKFQDGDASLISYIGENTKYPIPAQEQGIEGTVYIRFVVTKTGDVGEAIIMRSVDPLLDGEALRVVKSLPKWSPGKNNGNPVNVWFIIPVKFELK